MQEKAVPGRVLAQHFQFPYLKVEPVVVIVFQVQGEILKAIEPLAQLLFII